MPRWYYGWNVLAVALVFQGITFGLGLFSFTFFTEHWIEEFGAPRGELMAAVTAATLAIGAFGPFAGRAMDRYSIRAIVCTGGVLFALGFLALSTATAVWHVILIYATLMGGGLVLGGTIAGQTLAAKWFRGRRGLAVGLVTIGTSIGGFILPPLATWLIGELGWRTACVALAGLTLVTILPPVWLVVRNSPEEAGVEPDPESDHSRALASQFDGRAWTTRSIFRERAFWATVITVTLVSVVFMSIQQNLRPFTMDLGFSAQDTAYLMSTIAVVMIFGKIGFGWAADRYDNRYLFWLQAVLIAATVILLLREPTYALTLSACVLLGLAAGGTLPLMGSIVGNRFGPKAFGQVMGLMMPFTTISSFGPTITGWARDAAGSYTPIFEVFLLLLIPAVLSMALLPKLKRPAPSAAE